MGADSMQRKVDATKQSLRSKARRMRKGDRPEPVPFASRTKGRNSGQGVQVPLVGMPGLLLGRGLKSAGGGSIGALFSPFG